MTFNFIHFTDLHLGMRSLDDLWPNVEKQLFADIGYLVKKAGPIDLVLFSGDLVQKGDEREFRLVDQLLEKCWKKFSEFDCWPQLLAVPGNHDLSRPANLKDPATLNLLKLWNDEDVYAPFWEDAASPQRAVVNAAFENYTNWWNSALRKPSGIQEGLLPGDFSVTLEKDDFRIGILGLNTTFLQLTGGDFSGKLALHARQFHTPCNGHGPDWADAHDMCILMTHQGPEWLDQKSQDILKDEIYTPGRFAFNLFGHMHEPQSGHISEGFSAARLWLQGPSLFGIDTYGEAKDKDRIHGYQLGQCSFKNNEIQFRVFPRIAAKNQAGGRIFERNMQYGLPRGEDATASVFLKLYDARPSRQASPLQTKFNDSKYREHLANKTEIIDIRGIANAREGLLLPMLELYMKLHTVVDPKMFRDDDWLNQLNGTNNRTDDDRVAASIRIELTEAVAMLPYTLVTGDPGSGKTTFLRYLSRTYCGDPSKPLPLLMEAVDLFEFWATLSPAQQRPYWRSVLIYWLNLSDQQGWGFTENWLRESFENGSVIILFDGYDTLQKQEDRVKVCHVIEDFVVNWKKTRWILASRPNVAEGATRPSHFHEVKIAELESLEIKDFIHNWVKITRNLFPKELTANILTDDYAAKLIQTINERAQDIRMLASNPVMLTAMVIVHWNQKELPEGRAEIYEAIIEWLLASRYYGREEEYSPLKKRLCYQHLALKMFLDPGGRITEPSIHWAAETIAPLLADARGEVYQLSDPDQFKKAREFIDKEQASTGLIVLKGWDKIFFKHLSFQEYLAACEIASKVYVEKWWPLIVSNIENQDWRNMLRFIPIRFWTRIGGGVDEFLIQVLGTRLDSSLSESARVVGLLGDILYDLNVYEFPFSRVPEYVAAREAVMGIFTPAGASLDMETKYEAAVALGKGGDPRFLNSKENWIPVPAGKGWIGAQSLEPEGRHYDELATKEQYPVHQVFTAAFDIGRFLVTVKEYAAFMDENGYQLKSFWSEAGWRWKEWEEITQPDNWEDQLVNPNLPVVYISWYEAEAYCNWLSSKHEKYRFQLPAEAEWEYVARIGDTSYKRYVFGNRKPGNIYLEANTNRAGLQRPSPVGLFPEDAVFIQDAGEKKGVFDLNGNVMEWTRTPGQAQYPDEVTPAGMTPETMSPHYTLRGGSWYRSPLITAYRTYRVPIVRDGAIGFRVIRRGCIIQLKGQLPALRYFFSLADYYVKHGERAYSREEAQAAISGLGPHSINIDSSLIDTLFPDTANLHQDGRRPFILKDARPGKFEFNLRYQDTRVKLLVEERWNESPEVCRKQAARLMETIAILLRTRINDGYLLWEIMTDNDLDALMYAIADMYKPKRQHWLIETGMETNNLALMGLLSMSNLEALPMEELILYVIYSGTVWWAKSKPEIGQQFPTMGQLEIDHRQRFTDKIKTGPCKILYIPSDNGELVWDLCFMLRLLEIYPDLSIELVINPLVVENDANLITLEKCFTATYFQKLKQHPRLTIFEEPNRRSSLDQATCSPALKSRLTAASIVFIKGAANFETIQKLPVVVLYAFVVNNHDSSEYTGYNRGCGIFVMIPPNKEGYILYEQTLKSLHKFY